MKPKTTKEKWNERGIKITLSKNGLNLLADMLADGCPRKFDGLGTTPIVCPLFSQSSPGNMCFRCWKKFLNHISDMEDENVSTDG